MNAETAPKGTMRRPTLLRQGEGCHGSEVRTTLSDPLRRGGGRQHVNKEQRATREVLAVRAWDPQPALREESAGPCRMTEGSVVARKPGNPGGAKGPWFQGADEAAREGGD